MKIKEAVDIINGTLTAKAMYNEHSIFMCYKHLPFDNHCFLTLRADTRSWGGVTLVSSAIDGVIPQDLARAMDVVQRLIDTPVKERFPEKKYRVRLRGFNSDGGHQYLTVSTRYSTINLGSVFAAAWNTGLKQTFTADELNKIRERFKGSKWIISMMKDGVEEVGE